MAHDDEAQDPTSSGPAFADRKPFETAEPAGRGDDQHDIHDDDALADALAAEYTLIATSAIPIVYLQADAGLSNDRYNSSAEASESEHAEPGVPDAVPAEPAQNDFGHRPADEPYAWPAEPEPAIHDNGHEAETAHIDVAEPPVADEGSPGPQFPAGDYPALFSGLSPATPPAAIDGAGWPIEDGSVSGEPDMAAWPAPAAWPEPEPAPEARPDPEPELTVWPEPPAWPAPEPTTAPESDRAQEWLQPVARAFVSPFDPPSPTAVIPDPSSAPWTLLPAPDPSMAVKLPEGPPQLIASTPREEWSAPDDADPHHDEQSVDPVSALPEWEPTPWQPPAQFDDFEGGGDTGEPVVDDAVAAVSSDLTSPATIWDVSAPEIIESDPVALAPLPEGSEDDIAAFASPNIDGSNSDPDVMREAPNAWTAWAPRPTGTSEWDAAAPTTPEPEPMPEPEPEPDQLSSQDSGADLRVEADSTPEPFPWSAAEAPAPPLVAPVEREPFNWSITATGKVAYLDEQPADSGTDDAVTQEDSVSPATDPEPTPALSADPGPADDVQRMFLPPPLVEPLSPPQPAPVHSELPSAPPVYLPVGTLDEAHSGEVAGQNEEPVEASAPELSTGDGRDESGRRSPFEALFGAPVAIGEIRPVTTETGSVTVIDPAYEQELDDDVDDTDRVFASLLTGRAGVAPDAAYSPPSGPISTVRAAEDESVFFHDEPKNSRILSLERAGLEPTPVERRAGEAARLFWLWFSANSSVVSVALGAVVFAAGMSLRQSIVAILAGVALSFFPLALTTLAGKRSAQPTMVVSRATFGLIGNVVPALLAVVSRLFWGALFLWLLSTSAASVFASAGVSIDGQVIALVVLAVTAVASIVIAFTGYSLMARIQLILSIVSGLLIVGFIGMTAPYIDIPQALTVPDGAWLLALGGAVLVFSFVGLVWAHSGADLARYQRPDSSGASSMFSATFGTAIPAFVLVAYGAILSASDPELASGLATRPIDTLAGILPSWYPVPLLAAVALSLLSGIVISLYSGGLALQSVGVTVSRHWSVVVIGVVVVGLAMVMLFTVTQGIGDIFRDLATTLAVPTAAWIGIFGCEMMIRNRRFESESLLTRGGVYPDIRWANLAGFVIISAIGFGLTTATVSWLSWQGFGFAMAGVPLDGVLASTDLGVLVALVLGLVLPLVAGIPAIRRQEATRA